MVARKKYDGETRKYLRRITKTQVKEHPGPQTPERAMRRILRLTCTLILKKKKKQVPEIMRTHQIDIPMSQIRTKIREEFERHRDVKDLAVIDILLFKGRQEYQETMNAWKQETHIMRYFIKDEAPPKPEGFLEKFLAGRD